MRAFAKNHPYITGAAITAGAATTTAATYAGLKYLNNAEQRKLEEREERAAKGESVVAQSRMKAAQAARAVQQRRIMAGRPVVQQPAQYTVAPIQRRQQPVQHTARRVVAPAPVVNRRAQLAQIPALLNQAIKGNRSALAQAKANAGNDQVLVTLINNYMNSNVARFLGSYGPNDRISTVKLNALVTQNEDLIETLAAKCGVQVTSLIPA